MPDITTSNYDWTFGKEPGKCCSGLLLWLWLLPHAPVTLGENKGQWYFICLANCSTAAWLKLISVTNKHLLKWCQRWKLLYHAPQTSLLVPALHHSSCSTVRNPSWRPSLNLAAGCQTGLSTTLTLCSFSKGSFLPDTEDENSLHRESLQGCLGQGMKGLEPEDNQWRNYISELPHISLVSTIQTPSRQSKGLFFISVLPQSSLQSVI